MVQFDNISESSTFWSAVNGLKKSDNCVSQSITANEWFNYFNNLLNPDIQFNIFSVAFNLVINNDLDRNFSLQELHLALKSLKGHKAPGVDSIPGEFFKYLKDDALVVLLNIMNQIYDGGEFPKNFMEAIIFPLYKKGDLAIV